MTGLLGLDKMSPGESLCLLVRIQVQVSWLVRFYILVEMDVVSVTTQFLEDYVLLQKERETKSDKGVHKGIWKYLQFFHLWKYWTPKTTETGGFHFKREGNWRPRTYDPRQRLVQNFVSSNYYLVFLLTEGERPGVPVPVKIQRPFQSVSEVFSLRYDEVNCVS